jgi:hypothetical protein
MTPTSVSEPPDPAVYVRIDDIVSATDIARMLGVTVAAVSNWQNRKVGFPKHFKVVSNPPGRKPGPHQGTKLWRKSEVVAWYSARMDPEFLDTLIRNNAVEQAVRTTRKPT